MVVAVQKLADYVGLPCRIAQGCRYCVADHRSSCLVIIEDDGKLPRFGLRNSILSQKACKSLFLDQIQHHSTTHCALSIYVLKLLLFWWLSRHISLTKWFSIHELYLLGYHIFLWSSFHKPFMELSGFEYLEFLCISFSKSYLWKFF